MKQTRAVRPTKIAAHTAVVLSSAFLTILFLLHLLEPEFDPAWRLISEYELGRYGWMMTLAFFGSIITSNAINPSAVMRMNSQIRRPEVMMISQLSFDDKKSILQWWLLLLSVFVIHNLEEILFDIYEWEMTHSLPTWMEAVRKFHTSIQLTRPRFFMILLVICLVVSSLAFMLRNRPRASRNWMTTFVVIMLGVYLGHIVTSLYARSPQPGVYSAILQGMPVYSFVLYQLWRTRI